MGFNFDSKLIKSSFKRLEEDLDEYFEACLTENDLRSAQAKAQAMAKFRQAFHENCQFITVRNGKYPNEHRFLVTIQEKK